MTNALRSLVWTTHGGAISRQRPDGGQQGRDDGGGRQRVHGEPVAAVQGGTDSSRDHQAGPVQGLRRDPAVVIDRGRTPAGRRPRQRERGQRGHQPLLHVELVPDKRFHSQVGASYCAYGILPKSPAV